MILSGTFLLRSWPVSKASSRLETSAFCFESLEVMLFLQALEFFFEEGWNISQVKLEKLFLAQEGEEGHDLR
jgi:hypothetical protein